MNRWLALWAPLIAMLAMVGMPWNATAQQEFPPPSGKGRVVVLLSGASGAAAYRPLATRIAALGYDVVLFDSPKLVRTQGNAVRAAIAQALQMPHALPGKVGVVGLSQGGGLALGYATAWSSEVAVVAAWYPSTRDIKDAPALAASMKVPVVMFAGTADDYNSCCLIGTAREIDRAAKARNAPFELTIYPGVKHGFNLHGTGHDDRATEDAFARTQAALKRYLGD